MTLRSYKVDASPACVEDEASVEDRPIADTVLEPERDRLGHHPHMEDFVRQGIRKGGERLWLLTVVCDMLMVFIACLVTAFIMSLFGRNTALPLTKPSTFVPFVLGTMLAVFLVSLCTTCWRICSRGDLNSNEWPCSRDIGHIQCAINYGRR